MPKFFKPSFVAFLAFSLVFNLTSCAPTSKVSVATPSAPSLPQSKGDGKPTPDGEQGENGDQGSNPPRPPTPPTPRPPTPPPVPRYLASRILCTPQMSNASQMWYFRTDAGPYFKPSSFTFDLTGDENLDLINPVIVARDKDHVDLLVLNQNKRSKSSIWRSNVDLSKPRNAFAVLHSFISTTTPTEWLLQDLGLSASPMYAAYGSPLWLAPSSNGKSYELRDLRNPSTVVSINVSPSEFLPTSASENFKSIVWMTSEDSVLRLYLSETSTSSPNRIQPSDKTVHQMQPVFVNDTELLWIEKSSDKTVGTFKVRSYNVRSHQSRDIYTSTTGKEAPFLSAWATSSASDVMIAVATDSELLLINTKDLTQTQRLQLPNELQKAHQAKRAVDQKYPLTDITYLPWSQELVLSAGKLGGLVSYSLKTRTWSQHGAIDTLYKCLNPTFAPDMTSPQPTSTSATGGGRP